VGASVLDAAIEFFSEWVFRWAVLGALRVARKIIA
jgi:hypothetical protein